MTFLYVVASKSNQDLQILEEVVHTMNGVREASHASRRLYRICNAFLRLARELSQARYSSIGIYDHHNDSLQLANGSSQPAFSPELFQDSLGIGLTDYLSPLGASYILDSWASRQPLPVNMFDAHPILE